MTRLADYATKYQTIRMERRDGILQMTFHTDGGPLQWGLLPHGEFPQAFRDVGSDPENRVQSLEWDLDGDNVFDDAFGATAQNTFDKPGNHTVRLKITDRDGGSATLTWRIVTRT